jgi:hypothetical protein
VGLSTGGPGSTATLHLSSTLHSGTYRLFVCGGITSLFGLKLNGGRDSSLSFRVDSPDRSSTWDNLAGSIIDQASQLLSGSWMQSAFPSFVLPIGALIY